MSAIFQQMLDSGSVKTILMVEIDHPVRFIRAWNGLGDLDYDGQTYEGMGYVGQVNPIGTSADIEVPEVSLGLSGVDADALEGLDESVKGRFAEVYEAFLDDHYRVVERTLLFRCRLDYQTYKVDPESGKADMALFAHAGLFHLLNRSGAKMSPEEAKALDPDETGYDEVHLQQDLQLIWKPS